MSEGALSGYRVLDVTHYISGPYLTRLVAGLGAEVIKVEKPGEGDGARRLGPFCKNDPNIEKSILFLYLNTGKKSITLNLKSATGAQIFKELVKHADMVTENFEPRVLPSLGLDYGTLSGINPKIVMTSISNFGQDGPYRDYKAAEIVEYAMSGLMYITGDSDREPLKLGFDVAQFVAGQNALVPTLAALYLRNLTGKGQHIDISIMEYCAGLLEFQIPVTIHVDHIPGRIGRANEKGHPWGAFPCRNGWVAIAAGDRFDVLTEAMGIPELMDPKFSTAYGRIQNRDELDAIMMPWLLEHDKEEIFHLIGGNMPTTAGGMVLDTEEIVNCPQLGHHEFFREIEHPVAGRALYPGRPFWLSETPWQMGRAPLLGEHNGEVYHSLLGYTDQDLVYLKQDGAI
jgi:CoA:oxalate CoA-transferase